MRSLPFVFAILIAVCPATRAQDLPLAPLPERHAVPTEAVSARGGDDALQVTARWPFGYARDVAFAGDIGVTMQGSVFQTLDLSTPGAISVLGEIVLPGVVAELAAEGTLAVVAVTHFEDDNTGLFVIDVSDPAAPQIRGKVTGIGYSALALRDGVVYAGTFRVSSTPTASMRTYSLANPDAPTETGEVALQVAPEDIALWGDRAFVALTSDGLAAFDVSGSLRLLGTSVLDYTAAVGVGEVGGAPVLGAVVRDAEEDGVLRLYDPADGDLLGEVELDGTFVFGPIAMGLTWAGETAVVGGGFTGLQFVDVRDPAAPSVLDQRRTNVARVVSGTSRVASDGARILAVDVYSGLHLAEAASRDLTAYLPAANFSLDVERDLATDRLYVANGTNGLVVLQSVSSVAGGSERLDLVGRVHGPDWNYASGVAQTVSHVYVADGFGGVWTVDKATQMPTDNQLAGVTAPIRRVAVTDDGSLLLAVVGSSDDALASLERVVHVFSLADPAVPALQATIELPSGANDVGGTGPEIWIASFSTARLFVYDATSPAAPVQQSETQLTGFSFRLAQDGDRLYALGSRRVTTALDVSAPMAPVSLGTVQTVRRHSGLDAQGDALLLGGVGLSLYDITSLDAPQERAVSLAFGDELTDVEYVAPGQAAIAAFTAGVYAVTVAPITARASGPLPEAFAVSVAPNPMRGAATVEVRTDEPTTVRVEILDVLGRRVRLLGASVPVVGRAVLAWDGRDDAGARLPAGVYLLRLGTEAGGVVTRMVTVVR